MDFFVFDLKENGGSWACDSWTGLFSLFFGSENVRLFVNIEAFRILSFEI